MKLTPEDYKAIKNLKQALIQEDFPPSKISENDRAGIFHNTHLQLNDELLVSFAKNVGMGSKGEFFEVAVFKGDAWYTPEFLESLGYSPNQVWAGLTVGQCCEFVRKVWAYYQSHYQSQQ